MVLVKQIFWTPFIIFLLGKATNPIATQNIKHGEDFFVVDGRYTKDNRDEKIVVSQKKGIKKLLNATLKPMTDLVIILVFYP